MFRNTFLLLLFGSLVACAPSPVTVRPDRPARTVTLISASTALDSQDLLDVGLIVFDPGISESSDGSGQVGVYPRLRIAEARYLPFVMRNTLERTNFWGAVRVLPQADPGTELQVSGTILKSDGVVLILQVEARDSTGMIWMDNTYTDYANRNDYLDSSAPREEPFQDLFNEVANDLSTARSNLTGTDLLRIQEVSKLRYAGELSPMAFGDYLATETDGTLGVNRLPAANDPMYARVERLRESEYLFIDTVDQSYAAFYYDMRPTYKLWRRYSYGQTLELEETGDGSYHTGRSGRRGSFPAMKQVYDTYKDFKLQEQALRELAESFDAEISPTVLDLEGRVINLNGSMEAQYGEWRRLLRLIYAEEVGLPLTD